MNEHTGRTVSISDQVEGVPALNAFLRLSDRPNLAWVPATGNEHANLAVNETFTTTRTWVPGLTNPSAGGLEIIVTTTAAPGSGQTLSVILDHFDLHSAGYVAVETLGTISGTGPAPFQCASTLTGRWQVRLVPSGAGSWSAGAGYAYLQMPRGNATISGALPAGNNNIGDVDVASIAAGDNNIGNVDVVTLPALPAGTNNIGDVDVLTLPAGTVAGSASLPAGTNNIGDVDVLTLPALPAGTNNIGDVDVLTLPAGTVAGGASLPAGTNNIGDVDVLTLPAGTVAGSASLPAGTNNIGDVDIASGPTGASAVQVQGTAAVDAPAVGNPVRTGAAGQAADITPVTAADAVDLLLTLLGKQVVLPHALPANTWSYPAAAGGLVNTTGVTARAAAGAGIRNYVSKVSIINSHQTISTEVVIRDGAAGTVLWRGWAQAAGGGQVEELTPPLRGTANTLVEIAEITTTATAGVLVNLQGYVAQE